MARGPLALTAELVARAHPRPVADDEAAMTLLSEAETEAALDRAMAARPGPPDALWLFAYGSLMWRPEFPFAEQRTGRLRGWHRRFCLWQRRFRGSVHAPGLMLALDRGGQCRGVAYRLEGPDLRAAVTPVWRREMRGRGYEGRWLRIETEAGPVPALTFVANRRTERYAGRLDDAALAGVIARACGHIGPSATYLLNTVAACEALGIHDRHLWTMQARVAALLKEAAPARSRRPRPYLTGDQNTEKVAMDDNADYDINVRTLSEAIYEAYAQTATMPAHPMGEQSVVTRLVEALEPLADRGEAAQVEAVNAVLDAFEDREPKIRGQRVAELHPATGRVVLKPR